MKSQLISSMSSFLLGTGASIIGIMAWTGSTDLQEIRTSVQSYMVEVEQQASALATDYQVQVNQANAEIGDYQDALAQANSNINKLISAYEEQAFNYELELKGQQSQAEQDLADLQQAYDELIARIESDYESNVNYYIEQANAQIQLANEEVAQTKEKVLEDLATSQVDEIVQSTESLQVNTGGDKSVVEITDIVGE